MSLHISHSSLSKLETTQAWMDSGIQRMDGFSAEGIYGPEGKLQWLWPFEWEEKDQMKSSLCTNMGGGVPISIIDALVEICVDEEGC